MSSNINPVKLYQISMNYDRHRLKINTIKSKSSPQFRKQKQQRSIMNTSHAYHQYNAKFKHRQSTYELNRKNNLILTKLEDLSRVKRPNSTSVDKLRYSIVLNRSNSKRQVHRTIEKENTRFVKKLTQVKSTISNNKQNNSFSQHMRRSQMLSKFKKDERGKTIPKNSPLIEKRLKLQPIHQKLQVIESTRTRIIQVGKSPLKFNSLKLLKMNPEKS